MYIRCLCSAFKKKQVSQNASLQIQTMNQENSLLAHNFVNSKQKNKKISQFNLWKQTSLL